MEPINDWYYSELLDLFKQKEREKEESYYRPIELELPLFPQQIPIGDESPKEEEETNRGVIIIDL